MINLINPARRANGIASIEDETSRSDVSIEDGDRKRSPIDGWMDPKEIAWQFLWLIIMLQTSSLIDNLRFPAVHMIYRTQKVMFSLEYDP